MFRSGMKSVAFVSQSFGLRHGRLPAWRALISPPRRPRTSSSTIRQTPRAVLAPPKNSTSIDSDLSIVPEEPNTLPPVAERKPYEGEEDGPPLQYDREALQAYWSARQGELNQRYLAFAGRAAPFVASVLRHVATRRLTEEEVIAELAVQAREGMEALGPTYVKMGQMMSIRPDVIPAPAMRELQKLQDGVARFDNDVAREVVEEELGCKLEDAFSEFSEEPIAAASLAQVYRGRLKSNGVEVAIKVQRPTALALCSKDMYVLQRAIGVYQGVMQRWTAQNVDYIALLENFASGFYMELDFLNEARSQDEARTAILKSMGGRVYVPKVFFEYSSRRLLVTEFVYGSKLTSATQADMQRLVAVGQECFLQQLLDEGRSLHGDPHGGNILAPDREATAAAAAVTKDMVSPDDPAYGDLLPQLDLDPELYLLDFGLTVAIPEEQKPKLVLAIVHMANKDWTAVTDDFVDLGFLPDDVDRKMVGPILEKVLAPYVLDGGGAKAFIGEGVFSPSFQNLVRDLSMAAVQIPFSIPAFYASASRAIAILEGLALVGDPDYKIVLSAYPFVTRKLLEEKGDETLRTALNEILYPRAPDGSRQPRPSPRRMMALLNNAIGRAALLDSDASVSEMTSVTEAVAFLGSERATAIRGIVVAELVEGIDLVLRSLSRRVALSNQGDVIIPVPLPSIPFLPKPELRLPNPLRAIPEQMRDSALDRVAPQLSTEEDIFVGDILEFSKSILGVDVERLATNLTSPAEIVTILSPAVRSAVSNFQTNGAASDALVSTPEQSVDGEPLLKEFMDLLPVPGRSASAGPKGEEVSNEARLALESIGEEVFDNLKTIQSDRLGL